MKKNANTYEIKYNYLNINEEKTTSIIESIENGTDKISYQYDSIGNITKILENNIEVASYHYDTLNQLVKEDNKVLDRTITYTYDNGGNLLEKKYYSYKTENLLDTITYIYSTTWKDQLTSYDGVMITYDVIGNPITIGNSTLTWVNGRILQSYSNGTNNYQYKYNEDGIRIEKNINGKVTKYFLNGNDILFEDRDGEVLTYTYDESGVSGIIYQGNRYYFVKNIQGDIIGILNSNYQKLVDYEYDSWGKIVSVKDQNGNIITDSNHIGNINPFRYRGYYYDSETGFYYLNSRYYNPEWNRFINADGIIGANQDIIAYNLYAYVSNNPVMFSDYNGQLALTATGALTAVVALGAMYYGGKALAESVYYIGQELVRHSYTSPSKRDSNTKDERNQYIYFLTKGEKVIYVGRTKNLASRKNGHLNSKNRGDLNFKPYNENEPYTRSQARAMEQYFILKYQTLNKNDPLAQANRINGIAWDNPRCNEYFDSINSLIEENEVYVGYCK